MESKSPVANLVQVSLRDIWADEVQDFTPWLASEEGLGLMGDEIGCKLELIKREAAVGPFSADILARVVEDEDHKVVIENQLGKTNHDHLGKVITYAAGLGAKTLVWVSDKFCDEHREALNWLNQNTVEGLAFWGLEIRAYKIDNSRPAPQFSSVSSPIGTTKALRAEVSSIEQKTPEKMMELARSRHVESLTATVLKLSGEPQHYVIAKPSHAFGGAFRCWRRNVEGKSKMILGVNVSGKYKQTPDGQLDLWIPVPSVASVADVDEDQVRTFLNQLPVFIKGNVDWIIRLTSEGDANRVVELFSHFFDEHPGYAEGY